MTKVAVRSVQPEVQEITSDKVQKVLRFERTLFGDKFETAVAGWMCYTEECTYRLRRQETKYSSGLYMLEVEFNNIGGYDSHWCHGEDGIIKFLREQYVDAKWEIE